MRTLLWLALVAILSAPAAAATDVELLFAGSGQDVIDLVPIPAIKTPGKYLQSSMGSLVAYGCEPHDQRALPGTSVRCDGGVTWRIVMSDVNVPDRYVPLPIRIDGEFCAMTPHNILDCRVEYEGKLYDRAMIPVENVPKSFVIKLREGKGYENIQKAGRLSRIETDEELQALSKLSAVQAKQIASFTTTVQAALAQHNRELRERLAEAVRRARESAFAIGE
jgi:hypothetical protein